VTIVAINSEGAGPDAVAMAPDLVGSHRGKVIEADTTALLASFDGPTRAIRCSAAMAFHVSRAGSRPRIGVHTGECETVGAKVSGSAVEIAKQLMEQAQPGEVLATQTVRGLVTGSGFAFARRGLHAFPGGAGELRVYAVTST